MNERASPFIYSLFCIEPIYLYDFSPSLFTAMHSTSKGEAEPEETAHLLVFFKLPVCYCRSMLTGSGCNFLFPKHIKHGTMHSLATHLHRACEHGLGFKGGSVREKDSTEG